MSAFRAALRDLPDPVFADVFESDEAYLLVLDLPGVTADDVTVSTTGGTLAVEAQRTKDVPAEFAYVREDRPVFLDVEIPLPPTVAAAEANATVDRGVLEICLPKTGAAPETQIPVEDA